MSDDLSEIEKIAGGLLRRLSAGQRRTLLRVMARDLARSQRDRIAAQRAPDGSAFEPRKERTPPTPGRYAVSFLYPSSNGTRRVTMRSWTSQNDMMTGFDTEAGAIRSFQFKKVVKWLPVPVGQQNAGAGKLRRRGALRRKAMFRQLATARYLRADADDHGFWVGFTGRASSVAQIHQEGLRDRPSAKARAMPYPHRPLLGMSAADREAMLDRLYAHLADGAQG